MKITTFNRLLITGIFFLVLSCSVKKDKFVNRLYHAKTTKYNILYNGGIALEKGLLAENQKENDNFWEILPVEKLQTKEENLQPDEKKNADFEMAETKAIKAIQKHSMNIAGKEKNFQMDEAYILLGKARYYGNRFIPALEAFNYILYKYPNSDKIYDAKVWREKINIQLENEETAIKNLKNLIEEGTIEGQDLANANAMLAQAYINVGVKDTAITHLKVAKTATKNKEEKARYGYILGQLYELEQKKDSAIIAFEEVIEMNRQSPRKFVMRAHGKVAQLSNYNNNDSVVFLKKFHKLLEDRENRPFLDVLNHTVALYYDGQKNNNQALKHYNTSLKKQTTDFYLAASNYRNIAEIYFNDAKYEMAGKYYDSTLLRLNERTREYRAIAKKRANLEDVIKYEKISRTNDSIIYINAISDAERDNYFTTFIEKKKAEDAKKEKLLAIQAALDAQKQKNAGIPENNNPAFAKMNAKSAIANTMEETNLPPSGNTNSNSTFYFYNATTVAFGKTEFVKKWGSLSLKDNWKWNNNSFDSDSKEDNNEEENSKEEKIREEYTLAYYLKDLPTKPAILDSLKTERNFADFQLGVIYKEKFKEYTLAANKLEKLLSNQPEERLILPAKYHLYKIYEILKSNKLEDIKNQILTEYPDSRYAEIIKNPNQQTEDNQSPEAVYKNLYKSFEEGSIREALITCNSLIDKYAGDEVLPKYELLKTQIIARLEGVENYKKALNFVALNYPNAEEGKLAEKTLAQDIPVLEKLTFEKEESNSWKIIYPKNFQNNTDKEQLIKKIETYLKDRNNDKIKLSIDLYNQETDFIVIHGFTSKQNAQGTINFLQENKEYKINDEAFAISSKDYSVIQMQKNKEDYLKQTKSN